MRAGMLRTLESAAALYKRGFHEEALDTIENSLAIAPDDGRLWELRGLVLRATGNIPLACDSLEHASLLVPLSSGGQVTLADCLARTGHGSVAVCIAEHILSLANVDWSLLLYLAQVCDNCGRPDLSIAICREVNWQAPDCHQAFYDLGYYLGRHKQPLAEIEAAARQAIALAPSIANYRVGLASLLWQQERRETAFREADVLSLAELHSLKCECCLRRLVKIFWQAHAFAKSSACVERLAQLQRDTKSAGPDCCL
ncbi:tetratricopeptide repeat protein [Anatilimnocola sp. NA78]|uniref:tetratricopeptide repeat protein n=1 Tax=Anatilimnocola sp. NA78 TaxID=3415683 RepID=UPI003CE5B5F9